MCVKGLNRRLQHQLDLAGHSGAVPVRPAHLRVLVADVAGEDAAVIGQRQRGRQRTVSGEDTDLDRAAGAEQLDQHLQQRALLRRDLHRGMRMRRGRFTQLRQLRMLAVVSQHVIVQAVVDRQRTAAQLNSF